MLRAHRSTARFGAWLLISNVLESPDPRRVEKVTGEITAQRLERNSQTNLETEIRLIHRMGGPSRTITGLPVY